MAPQARKTRFVLPVPIASYILGELHIVLSLPKLRARGTT